MRKYPIYEHRVKHQIHYALLEKVIKKNCAKQFKTVTTHKNVQNYYNEKCNNFENNHF